MWHRVEVEGLEHVQRRRRGTGPARLLFSGHQNGLADPVLACVSLPEQLHYFTRSDVFANPVARWFILRLNMMPMFRPIDRTRDMADRNRITFAAAHGRLDGGASCGLVPAAGPLDARRTRRFKHGSARFILNALTRPAIRKRGLEVIPMALDFERYEGYRSTARIRIAPAVDLSFLPAEAEDVGHHRILLSDHLRQAMLGLSVELLEGDLYDAHLALCRYEEGRTGGRPDPDWLEERGQALRAAEAEALTGVPELIASGMPHPRTDDSFAAIGRLHGAGPTPWWPLLWRLPAWIVFRLTTGWWPRLLEPLMARRVRQVAFRTTFAIPANMVAVLLTWSTLALCAGWMAGSVGLGLGTLAVLRACQSLAMPLEDAWIDRAEERRAMPFSEADWIVRWAGGPPQGMRTVGLGIPA